MKVVINKCYGGFGLSKEAMVFMGFEWDGYGYCSKLSRSDPKLVKCVEQLGAKANGSHANLKIIEIPNNIDFTIEEYDGMEWVAEKHRTWG